MIKEKIIRNILIDNKPVELVGLQPQGVTLTAEHIIQGIDDDKKVMVAATIALSQELDHELWKVFNNGHKID